jgi:hypothetical protein
MLMLSLFRDVQRQFRRNAAMPLVRAAVGAAAHRRPVFWPSRAALQVSQASEKLLVPNLVAGWPRRRRERPVKVRPWLALADLDWSKSGWPWARVVSD